MAFVSQMARANVRAPAPAAGHPPQAQILFIFLRMPCTGLHGNRRIPWGGLATFLNRTQATRVETPRPALPCRRFR
eukprot:266403-Pyramimonas_sp.AAC.1